MNARIYSPWCMQGDFEQSLSEEFALDLSHYLFPNHYYDSNILNWKLLEKARQWKPAKFAGSVWLRVKTTFLLS